MIQRIQTIFLFVVVGALIAFNLFPYWQNVPADDGILHQLFPMAYVVTNGLEVVETFALFSVVSGLSILSAIITLIQIFQYKNRLTQMKIGALNSVIMTVMLGLMTYFVLDLQKVHTGSFAIGIFVLALAMLANVMARRFINRDEKLVKSIDRIR